MADIGQLTRAKIVHLTLDLGDGDTVELDYDRNKITPAWTEHARAMAFEERDLLSLPRALADVIVDWDVTQDGAPFPPTTENLAVFSFPVQQQLMTELLTAAVPGAAEGEASSATSSTPSTGSMPLPANHQNGQERSPSPAVSASPSPT